MIHTLVLLLITTAIANAENYNKTTAFADLKKVCVHGNTFLNKNPNSGPSKEFISTGAKLELKSPLIIEAWTAYLNAAPGSRYKFLEDASKKVSKTRWACPALKILGN